MTFGPDGLDMRVTREEPRAFVDMTIKKRVLALITPAVDTLGPCAPIDDALAHVDTSDNYLRHPRRNATEKPARAGSARPPDHDVGIVARSA